MAYFDGMVCAVPTENKALLKAHAEQVAKLVKDHGALAVVDGWGDDVPEGRINSFHTAVMREPHETIVFSWITWPDRETRNAGWQKIMADSAMADQPMPFDGSRMIMGGFEMLVEA